MVTTTERLGTVQFVNRAGVQPEGDPHNTESIRMAEFSVPDHTFPVAGSDTGSILLNPHTMQPDCPYVFRFLDHWMIAFADGAGGIAVYYVPNSSD